MSDIEYNFGDGTNETSIIKLVSPNTTMWPLSISNDGVIGQAAKVKTLTLSYTEGSSSATTGAYPTFSDRLAVDGHVALTFDTVLSAKISFAYSLKSDDGATTVYCKPKITINGNSYFGTERSTTSATRQNYYEEVVVNVSDIVNSACGVFISAATGGAGSYTAYRGRYFLIITYK